MTTHKTSKKQLNQQAHYRTRAVGRGLFEVICTNERGEPEPAPRIEGFKSIGGIWSEASRGYERDIALLYARWLNGFPTDGFSPIS